MAVRKDSENDGKAEYTIENGDLIALNRIRDQYHLNDSDDVIAFAIGVLSQAGGRPITVQNEDGTTASLLPSDDIKKS